MAGLFDRFFRVFGLDNSLQLLETTGIWKNFVCVVLSLPENCCHCDRDKSPFNQTEHSVTQHILGWSRGIMWALVLVGEDEIQDHGI